MGAKFSMAYFTSIRYIIFNKLLWLIILNTNSEFNSLSLTTLHSFKMTKKLNNKQPSLKGLYFSVEIININILGMLTSKYSTIKFCNAVFIKYIRIPYSILRTYVKICFAY